MTVSATGEKLAAKVVKVGVLSSSSSSTSTTGSSSSSSSSAVAYPVTLRLTQTSSKLKPGMTASADIVTEQSIRPDRPDPGAARQHGDARERHHRARDDRRGR